MPPWIFRFSALPLCWLPGEGARSRLEAQAPEHSAPAPAPQLHLAAANFVDLKAAQGSSTQLEAGQKVRAERGARHAYTIALGGVGACPRALMPSSSRVLAPSCPRVEAAGWM